MSRRHAIRNEWFWTVLAVCGRNNSEAPPARVTIVRVSNRLLDHQNVGGPTKPLLDALVEYGWLRGDGPKDVTYFHTDQRKCEHGEEPHMEVMIESR